MLALNLTLRRIKVSNAVDTGGAPQVTVVLLSWRRTVASLRDMEDVKDGRRRDGIVLARVENMENLCWIKEGRSK